MDFNDEQEVLISLREMENSDEEEFSENGVSENGHSNSIITYPCYQSCPNPNPKPCLSWLDLRVFYVRISKCVINDGSTPEHLTLNHVPLNRDTLLESNGVRTNIYSDGVSTLLKRDRLDKKSEEVTFVCTDSIRMTGSVKFEVFDIDVLVLSGTLELCQTNCSLKPAKNAGTSWIMNCESNANGIFRGHHRSWSSESASIEVYVAGCFSGSPIVLTRKLQLNQKKKHVIKGRLESIPEYEATQTQKAESSSLAIQVDYHLLHNDICVVVVIVNFLAAIFLVSTNLSTWWYYSYKNLSWGSKDKMWGHMILSSIAYLFVFMLHGFMLWAGFSCG